MSTPGLPHTPDICTSPSPAIPGFPWLPFSKKKPGFPKQPDWFLDARGFENLEVGLKKVGFSKNDVNGILGNNWYNFYKEMN